MLKLYCSFIRSHMEYAAIVWNPALKGDIESLENVQIFALRVCMKSWNTAYDKPLTSAKLPSLQDRQTVASLCHLFKIVRGLMDFPDTPVHAMTHNYDTRLSDKPPLLYLSVELTPTNTLFFPSILTNWNSLPREASQTNTIAAVKRHISCCYSCYNIILSVFYMGTHSY